MTPKQKAELLIRKYYTFGINKEGQTLSWHESKQCALIAVDALITQNGELYLNGLNGAYYTEKNNFLFEVKKEIELL